MYVYGGNDFEKIAKKPFGLFFKSFPKLLKSDIKFSHFDSCNLCVAVGVPCNINYHLWVNLSSLVTSLPSFYQSYVYSSRFFRHPSCNCL